MTDLEDGEIDMDTALSLLSISEFKDKIMDTKQNIAEALATVTRRTRRKWYNYNR